MTKIVNDGNYDLADAHPSYCLLFHGLSHMAAFRIDMSAITVIVNLDHLNMPNVNFGGG